jgi:hypothetical protein
MIIIIIIIIILAAVPCYTHLQFRYSTVRHWTRHQTPYIHPPSSHYILYAELFYATTIDYHFLSARSPLSRPTANTRCGVATGKDKRQLPDKIKGTELFCGPILPNRFRHTSYVFLHVQPFSSPETACTRPAHIITQPTDNLTHRMKTLEQNKADDLLTRFPVVFLSPFQSKCGNSTSNRPFHCRSLKVTARYTHTHTHTHTPVRPCAALDLTDQTKKRPACLTTVRTLAHYFQFKVPG